MLLAIVQLLFRAKFCCEFAWIAINGFIRLCRRRICLRDRQGLYAFCTDWGFTIWNCPYPKVLVDMLFALVHLLFRARFSREFPLTALYGVAGDGFVSRLVKVCAFSTDWWFPFINFPYPKVLVDMLFALLQPFFRAIGLTVDLREFPLKAYYSANGDGFLSRLVKVCALFVQTEGLHFYTLRFLLICYLQ